MASVDVGVGYGLQAPYGCGTHPHCGVELADGGLLMVGDTTPGCDFPTPFEKASYAVRTDRNGTELWSRLLADDIGYNYGKYGAELTDGTLLVTGTKSFVDPSTTRRWTSSRVMYRLDDKSGEILSETVMPNQGAQRGDREGFMGIAISRTEDNTAYVTGYVGAEPGYDDDPMFLIMMGDVSVTKFSFDASEPRREPTVVWDTTPASAGLQQGDVKYDPMMGMRIVDDIENNQLGVVSASITGEYDGNYGWQFGMIGVDRDNGSLKWGTFLPADNSYGSGEASHPYALTQAHNGDGFVVAGHALRYEADLQPEGRLVKVGPTGQLQWDTRYVDRDETWSNVECYGVDQTQDGGYVTTCGSGPMEELPWMTCQNNTWTSYVRIVDADGNRLQAGSTTTTDACQNNAGEDIITLRNGSYAVFVDSVGLGSSTGTKGHFGLQIIDGVGF